MRSRLSEPAEDDGSGFWFGHRTATNNLFPEWRRTIGLAQGRLPQMITSRTAVGAAQQLLMRPNLSPGFVRLRDGGRLDLTVERLILRPEHGSLFTAEQRGVARRKLVENGFARSELPLEPYD